MNKAQYLSIGYVVKRKHHRWWMSDGHSSVDDSRVDSVLHRFGQRLRELRRELGLTQDEVATRAGLTSKYLSEVENGHSNPSLLVLHAVAEKGLKMPLAALFTYDTNAKDAQDDSRQLVAIVAGQSRAVRRRALRVLQALVAE